MWVDMFEERPFSSEETLRGLAADLDVLVQDVIAASARLQLAYNTAGEARDVMLLSAINNNSKAVAALKERFRKWQEDEAA